MRRHVIADAHKHKLVYLSTHRSPEGIYAGRNEVSPERSPAGSKG